MLKTNKKQRGFSMIEVLVSLVVISVGMLGLSGLQIASVKGTNNAHSRTVASMLAMELSERMRANPQGVDAGNYDGVTTDCSAATPNQCGTNAYCNPANIAENDLYEVMCGNGTDGGIKNQLLDGSIDIDCDPACNQAGIDHEIIISWNSSQMHKDQDVLSNSQELRSLVTP